MPCTRTQCDWTMINSADRDAAGAVQARVRVAIAAVYSTKHCKRLKAWRGLKDARPDGHKFRTQGASSSTCIQSARGRLGTTTSTHDSTFTTVPKTVHNADVDRWGQILSKKALGIFLSSGIVPQHILTAHLNLPWYPTPACPVRPASLLEQSGSAKEKNRWRIAAVAMTLGLAQKSRYASYCWDDST